MSFFGAQPATGFGNETRFNPKLRSWPGFNENFSLARSITIKEETRLDFRWETFNLLNRTAFGSLGGGATLQNPNFGLWRAQANSQRRMQVSLVADRPGKALLLPQDRAADLLRAPTRQTQHSPAQVRDFEFVRPVKAFHGHATRRRPSL